MPLYLLPVIALMAVQPDAVAQDRTKFRADAKVVLVPTTVMDRKGALVTGLSSDSFTLAQDNVPQKIASFGEEDVPASLGIVFDTSGSMRPVLGQAKAVLRTFFDQCNPEDEAFLYTVSTRPDINSQFTSDFGDMLSHSAFFEADGATALVDTVYAAVRQMRGGHQPRKALLVISDGMENHSRYSKAELMAAAVEADVQIYSISVFDPPMNKKPIELQEERQGVFFLEELSRKTGGIQIVVRNAQDIHNAASTIGRAIRNQYVLGYIPENVTSDDKWHSIRIGLNRPDAKAYARSGFFAH